MSIGATTRWLPTPWRSAELGIRSRTAVSGTTGLKGTADLASHRRAVRLAAGPRLELGRRHPGSTPIECLHAKGSNWNSRPTAASRPGISIDSNAAVAVGDRRDVNSRFRPHCGHCGYSGRTEPNDRYRRYCGPSSVLPERDGRASACQWLELTLPTHCCLSLRRSERQQRSASSRSRPVTRLTVLGAEADTGSGCSIANSISLLTWVGPCCNPHVGGNPSWRASGVQPVQALRYE